MKPPNPNRLIALVSLASVLAYTPPLRAQFVPAGSSLSVPDPAFLARANATIDHSRKLIEAFFERNFQRSLHRKCRTNRHRQEQ